MNWLLGKLVDLINWWADRAENKTLDQDIPRGSRLVIYHMSIDYATPDRPSDPLRQEIDALTGRQVAVKYPEGS